jgi:RNA polymerase sigma-70 factor (ECF subfamily)
VCRGGAESLRLFNPLRLFRALRASAASFRYNFSQTHSNRRRPRGALSVWMTETASRERETWWVGRAQSGDRAALEELLKSVEAPLGRYVSRLVGGGALAEDILQEVFFRIYRKLRWLRDPELFRPWAYRIATREAFRALKRERRWSEQVRDEALLEALPSPDEEPRPSALIERLPQLVARLSPASRAVLLLHYLHELPLEEVADVLGVSAGTVKSRLSYGLAGLRRLLAEEETETKR